MLSKELEVELEDSFQQTVVRRIPPADIVEPQVDDEHLGQGQGKQGRLSLKALSNHDRIV